MMSAAARAGEAGAVGPGLGQRVRLELEGQDPEQRERNFVRIALAAAHNAAEMVPQVRDLMYDIGDDLFTWKRGKARRGR